MNTINTLAAVNGCEVRAIYSNNNWMEGLALEQLNHTAALKGMEAVVGMPDLHPGKGSPIGMVATSRDWIYPHLVGSDIGCGMGLWLLDQPLRKFKQDKWAKRLIDLDDGYSGWGNWVPPGDMDLDGIDELHRKIGTIGSGNHFAELQCIEQVFNADTLAASGLSKQAIVLLVHSGSRGVGQAILQQHWQAFGANPLAVGSEDFSRYIDKHNYAIAWAERNRQLIAKRFCDALKCTGEMILDVNHNTVSPIASQPDHWAHRKGASPTDVPLVMIPGSRGSLSYLVKPNNDNPSALEQAGHSLAHGAGRRWKRSDCKARLKREKRSAQSLLSNRWGSRVICENKNLVFEEAPRAYKNIDQVIQDLLDAELIEVIASFRPLITYKTRKS